MSDENKEKQVSPEDNDALLQQLMHEEQDTTTEDNQTTATTNEDDDFAAAMALLQEDAQSEGTAEESSPYQEEDDPGYQVVPSPTLRNLPETRRPKEKTVCDGCPNSMWLATASEVKCYCRVKYAYTWTNKEPEALILCDGVFIGQE